MSLENSAVVKTFIPSGSLLSGLLFLASAIGGLWSEYKATYGYDASQPYDWVIKSISDLGVNHRQVRPLKRHSVVSEHAQISNYDLMWIGVTFTVGQLYLIIRTRNESAVAVGPIRSIRVSLSILFILGAFLMALIHDAPREDQEGTVGWHRTGFTFMALAGNLNSILSGLQPDQVGGLDRNSVYRVVSIILGLAGFTSFVKFQFLLGEWNLSTRLGLWQRGSLYPVITWQMITGLGLVTWSMTRYKRKQM